MDSSAYKFEEERESENPQNVAQIDVVVGETTNSPAEYMSILQSARIGAEFIGAKTKNEDSDLKMAEKDCVLTSSEEKVEDLSFVCIEFSHNVSIVS